MAPVFDRKHSGAYFTPHAVACSLIAWAVRRPSDRLLDPSCGDGQFLEGHRNSVGIEQNPISVARAIERAPWALVHEGDFFTWAGATKERFHCAAGNPPFIRYQTFKGDVRKRAFALSRQLGADFSGLASSWAPFLVATAGLLKKGGRMAFVVPAEIGHAPYAAPLLRFLVSSFSDVRVVAVREKLFPSLSEDCWLLYAGGYGGTATSIGFTPLDRFSPSSEPPRPTYNIDLAEWQTMWGCRLRPYLLPPSIRALYADVAASEEARRLGDFASVGIGYVSGDNSFFHLRPSQAAQLGIPASLLHPSLRNSRAMPQGRVSREVVAQWEQKDEQVMLLRLQRGMDLPASVRRYLDGAEGRRAREGYKCRNRTPWYAVPDVQVPDYFMSYMTGRNTNLVRNDAGVTCTNSVHAVKVRDTKLARMFLPQWGSAFSRLSCELEGHALGGGMLKLEPREASRVLLPTSGLEAAMDREELLAGVAELQRWRHYAD